VQSMPICFRTATTELPTMSTASCSLIRAATRSGSIGSIAGFPCRARSQAAANPLTAQHPERIGRGAIAVQGFVRNLREAPGTILRPGVQYDRGDRQRACSASTLTTDFAKVVRAASGAFSSFSVASRSATASGMPSSPAQVRSVP
jgi:hypothetical protein